MGVYDFTYSFNPTGSPEMDEILRQQLANQRSHDEGRQTSRTRPQPRGGFANQGAGMLNDHGQSFAMGGFQTAMGATGAQANHLQGMINQAQGAWGREHESRVAQARENRRMQHEKDLLGMRYENDKDAEIAQLRQLIIELRAQLGQQGFRNIGRGRRR